MQRVSWLSAPFEEQYAARCGMPRRPLGTCVINHWVGRPRTVESRRRRRRRVDIPWPTRCRAQMHLEGAATFGARPARHRRHVDDRAAGVGLRLDGPAARDGLRQEHGCSHVHRHDGVPGLGRDLRENKSRRYRGRDADIQRSARGAAAAATRIFSGQDVCRRQRDRAGRRPRGTAASSRCPRSSRRRCTPRRRPAL